MTTIVRAVLSVAILAEARPDVAHAQAPQPSARNNCFRRPAPECRAFFITNAGAYVVASGANQDDPFLAILDWGRMVNVRRRHAVGLSGFVSLDEYQFAAGPVLRYRRWFENGRSLDVAVGTPVTHLDNSDGLEPGSILGLVKYNPVPWFGVALRPDYLRSDMYKYVCDGSICEPRPGATVRLSAGVEFGGVPGLALSVVSSVSLGVFIMYALTHMAY